MGSDLAGPPSLSAPSSRALARQPSTQTQAPGRTRLTDGVSGLSELGYLGGAPLSSASSGGWPPPMAEHSPAQPLLFQEVPAILVQGVSVAEAAL